MTLFKSTEVDFFFDEIITISFFEKVIFLESLLTTGKRKNKSTKIGVKVISIPVIKSVKLSVSLIKNKPTII